MNSRNWRLKARCHLLTTVQSDALFFPPPGGKSKKATIFCSHCKVQAECLQDALISKSTGFIAGTTKDERNAMKSFKESISVSLQDAMPPEPVRELTKPGRRGPQKLPKYDEHDYLKDVDGPTAVEELKMIIEL